GPIPLAFVGVAGVQPRFAALACGFTGFVEALLGRVDGMRLENDGLCGVNSIIPSFSRVGRQPVAGMTIGAPVKKHHLRVARSTGSVERIGLRLGQLAGQDVGTYHGRIYSTYVSVCALYRIGVEYATRDKPSEKRA